MMMILFIRKCSVPWHEMDVIENTPQPMRAWFGDTLIELGNHYASGLILFFISILNVLVIRPMMF